MSCELSGKTYISLDWRLRGVIANSREGGVVFGWQLYAAFLMALLFLVFSAMGKAAAPDAIHVQGGIVLIIPDTINETEKYIIDLFVSRFKQRSSMECLLVNASKYKPADVKQDCFVMIAGTKTNNALLSSLMNQLSMPEPKKPESFVIAIDIRPKSMEEMFPDTESYALICGSDSRGILYGLGKFLRLADYGSSCFDVSPMQKLVSPAISDRGIYFATHFNNYYECAPLDEINTYIEDQALWGANAIWTWFDMHWYPNGFWNDANSSGMKMIERIRFINKKASSLGLKVGLCGVANEVFKMQEIKELLADDSAKRGAWCSDTTVCPSKSKGLKLIHDCRRQVLKLIGPIDAYWHWPYDPGGCGCELCRPWGKTFMEMGPQIASIVKEYNPHAQVLISTWYLDDAERNIVYKLCDEDTSWFDGLIMDVRWAGEHTFSKRYAKMVFPEISMFGSINDAYGGSGANPNPKRFAEEAATAARLKYGAAVYSEGIYEDVNKIIWISMLWDPNRTAEDVVNEYAHFYFSGTNQTRAFDLIMGLEQTWPPGNLVNVHLQTVEQLRCHAQAIQSKVPSLKWCHDRWQILNDRAEMDYLIVKAGSEKDVLQVAQAIFNEAAYTRDWPTLRTHLQDFQNKLEARTAVLDAFFAVHWNYLTTIHTQASTVLVLRPPAFVGERDWPTLLMVVNKALAQTSGEAMQMELLKGFKKWFWFNNYDPGFSGL